MRKFANTCLRVGRWGGSFKVKKITNIRLRVAVRVGSFLGESVTNICLKFSVECLRNGGAWANICTGGSFLRKNGEHMFFVRGLVMLWGEE